jgi:hypothetical protein
MSSHDPSSQRLTDELVVFREYLVVVLLILPATVIVASPRTSSQIAIKRMEGKHRTAGRRFPASRREVAAILHSRVVVEESG